MIEIQFIKQAERVGEDIFFDFLVRETCDLAILLFKLGKRRRFVLFCRHRFLHENVECCGKAAARSRAAALCLFIVAVPGLDDFGVSQVCRLCESQKILGVVAVR